jgi:hypothetical protein
MKNSISFFHHCANDAVLLSFTLLVFAQEFISCVFACEKNTFAQQFRVKIIRLTSAPRVGLISAASSLNFFPFEFLDFSD